MLKALVEPWKSFFCEIDASIQEEVWLHCLGGFVMTMLYGLARPTSDVDVLPVASNEAIQKIIDSLAKVLCFTGNTASISKSSVSQQGQLTTILV